MLKHCGFLHCKNDYCLRMTLGHMIYSNVLEKINYYSYFILGLPITHVAMEGWSVLKYLKIGGGRAHSLCKCMHELHYEKKCLGFTKN